jgi:hypothetical protein
MKLKTKLAASLLLMGSASMAQATITTYAFDALFNEPQINGTDLLIADTRAVGTFQWDNVAMQVVSMSLRMNESMAGGWTATGNDYINGVAAANTQMLTLNNLLDQGAVAGYGNTYFASAFKNNSTSIWGTMASQGTTAVAYDTQMTSMMNTWTDGTENAFYKLAFQVDGNGNIITGSWAATVQGINPSPSTWATADQWLNQTMMYGDCTIGSLMGGGVCMVGDDTAASMMAGSNQSLTISQVAAVPVPAAAWLFGGALMSLFGANRRKSVLPA